MFFGPCMVIDSRQKRFVMNMQLRQCFATAKHFRLKNARKGHILSGVATSLVVLRWLCDSPWTGCAWRITPLCMWREQAIIEWSRRVISIVACCHGAKLCAHAARNFRSQQNGAVTRMWRSCQVQPSHKERAIGVVRCKKEGMLLQPLRWCCVDCVIHHKREVREE